MPASNTIDFLQIFRARREFCRVLLELSRQQMDLIAEDNYTRLLEVLGKKQRILGRLDEFGRNLPELWQEWREQRGGLEGDVRQECEALLEETETILAELVKEEKAGTDFLTERRDAAQRQLQAVSQGVQVNEAYRDSLAPSTHRHLDIDQ